MPVVQVNVTVEEASVDPGTGETICASTAAPGVLVGVGMDVLVGVAVGVRVAVAVGVFDGVSEGPGVDDGVGLGKAVEVEVGIAVAGGAAGVEVTTPGPYG